MEPAVKDPVRVAVPPGNAATGTDPTARNTAPAASSQRVATIDVGSNSIRLIVAELHPDGSYRLLDDEKDVTRLGRGTATQPRLDPEAMQDSVRVIRHMRGIAEGYGATVIRAVATCAVREASNREEFLEQVRHGAGIDLEVIDGDTEAHLAWLSASHAFDVADDDVAVVDIGGGSTEIVLATGGIVRQMESFSVGAVRLAELVPDDGTPAQRRLDRMRRIVKDALTESLARPSTRPSMMIGTGGTFTTLALVHLLAARRGEPDDLAGSVRGHLVIRAELRRTLENLAAMSAAERIATPGISLDRSEILVPGLVIAESVMRHLRINSLKVHDRGIRDGLLIAMTEELFPGTGRTGRGAIDRIAEVRRFAERCRYERDHSEHVTGLALSIYDQLAEPFRLAGATAVSAGSSLPRGGEWPFATDPAVRELLQTAAILHDIGYYINYSKHHKHSLHLILHSDLAGFTHRELRIIANVARYHRRSAPRRKHPEFRELAPRDQMLVRQLSAILRIADGLDRAHCRNVTAVRVTTGRRSARFIVDAEHRPEVELWGAERKSELFQETFALIPRFEWSAEPEVTGA